MTEDEKMYKITFEGQSIDLPNYTLEISRKIESLNKVDEEESIEVKLQAMYSFIDDILGTEKTVKVLGEYEECDPNLINILFLSIIDEYDRPRKEYVMNRALKDYQDPRLKNALNALDKTANLD